MLVIRCIEKIRDNNGRITHYKIQDTERNIKIVTANQLKVAISNMQVNCINLTLTSDNRLIDKETKEELDREKIRHKKLIVKISLLGNKLGDTTYKLNNAIYEIVGNEIYLKEVLVEDGDFEIPEFVSGFCREKNKEYSGFRSDVFKNCRNIKLKNKSRITDMSGLFADCELLRKIDMSEFDTSRVTDMSDMFAHCLNLSYIDMSNVDTSNVVNMEGMFADCESLEKLNIQSFNTSRVNNMGSMFGSCYSLKNIDVSHFDTRNVVDMSYMFFACYELKSLNISGFSINNNVNLQGIFDDSDNLEVIYASKTAAGMLKDLTNKYVKTVYKK